MCSFSLVGASGPTLSTRKAKVAWEIVCRRKCDGGLGLRSLKEVNQVCCLKLVWRTVSSQASLWAKWTKENLFKNVSFWSIKDTTTKGSWMWRKLVKLCDKAKEFHRMKVGDGNNTSFWFDSWSSMGRLFDLFGPHGCIDMGISLHSTVAGALRNRRKRRHRVDIFNEVEKLCEIQSLQFSTTTDTALWKQSEGQYKAAFSTKATWELIRREDQHVQWWRGVWFKHHTPKYAFIHWLAIQNRLATGDRMMTWNVGANSLCVLCQNVIESRDHLFFECPYSAEVWSKLARGLLRGSFTTLWSELMVLIKDNNGGLLERFLFRYTLQVTLSSLWRERNDRRHGSQPIMAGPLVKMIERQVKNRCLSLRQMGDLKFSGALTMWFATR